MLKRLLCVSTALTFAPWALVPARADHLAPVQLPQTPAYSGDVAKPTGSGTMTIQPSAVTAAKMAASAALANLNAGTSVSLTVPLSAPSPIFTGTFTVNDATTPAASNPFVFTSSESAALANGSFRYTTLINSTRLSGGTGNRTALVAAQFANATSQSSDQIVGLEAIGVGGANAVAQMYGFNPICQYNSGTSTGAGCTAVEADVLVNAQGLTRRTGIQIYDIGSQYNGSQIDAALFFAGNPSTSPPSLPFQYGIQFGFNGNNSTIGVSTTGTMIGAGNTGTVKNVLDFGPITPTNLFINGPNGTFTVDPSGSVIAGKSGASGGNITSYGTIFGSGGNIVSTASGYSAYDALDTGAGTDLKRWRMNGGSGTLHFAAVNDAVSAVNDWLTVSRSGATATLAAFSEPVKATAFTVASPLVQSAAPTIASGFGTSPSIVASNGPAAFSVNVGTGGAAGSGNIGLPTAANGWTCSATDITTNDTARFLTKQYTSTTSNVQLVNYNTAGGVVAWASGDILRVSCLSY